MNTLTILKNAKLYAPQPSGRKDILIGGGRILCIQDDISCNDLSESVVNIVECSELTIIPGLIDGHVHVAGAGGEGGPATRTPEVNRSQLLDGGITTVIGCLGTDGFTRSPRSVLMKVKALRAEGISSWMLTGAYQVPSPTITGDIGKDIAFIEEVIGVGELALSDHRASFVDTGTLIDVASKARVGGMLGGKAGIVQIHMGDAEDPLRPIYNAIEQSMIPLDQFMPTHMNRNAWIFKDALEFGRKGGRIDLTTSSYPYFPDDETKPSSAVRILLENDVPLDRITLSSDGNGSLPGFDDKGNLVRLELGQPASILRELVDMVKMENLPLEVAVSTVTSNPAAAYKLTRKGTIHPGYDADLVLLDEEFGIRHVMAQGVFLVKDGSTQPDTFGT